MAAETTKPQIPEAQKPPALAPKRPSRWSGYRYLLWVRLLELKREPEIIFWVFGFPLLLSLGLGVAFRNKPADQNSVAVVAGPNAAQIAANLGGSGSDKRSILRATVVGREAALKAFRLGKFDVVVEQKDDGTYWYYYDPARPESMFARLMAIDTLEANAGRADKLQAVNAPSSAPGSRYIDFLIPGLIGMNLMNSGMWGVGFALVDMRQRKLLKRFVATPMRRSDFLMAVMSSRLILMVIEVGLLLVFGMLVFHMPVAGSLWALALVGSIAAVAFGGLGLLTACRAQKVESASGLINLVMMPMWIFSGVFFSYEHFPAVAQPFIKALPLTALNDVLRAIILEGASLPSQSVRLLILALWGGISFALALKWFRWV
ncbi:MAG TPA: ABC transporter permease [Terriglobales bacterium]|nr:ABC transporter permease [Terriglobales bacterium]